MIEARAQLGLHSLLHECHFSSTVMWHLPLLLRVILGNHDVLIPIIASKHTVVYSHLKALRRWAKHG